ncbi:MAG TPA: hypothetical protein ENK66_00235 [Arcobacter sp.]|nr:hypothetical protein [Arcobacter sp.]
MKSIQIQDTFITMLLETKFYNDKAKFVEAVKELFQTKSKLESQEYNLLKAYEKGELSLGQVANILNLSKVETVELLKQYDIPFIQVDNEYLEQEFNAFK